MDRQDRHVVVARTINDEKRRPAHHEFARARLPTLSAEMREASEAGDRLANTPYNGRGGGRPIGSDVSVNLKELSKRMPGVANRHRQRT